MRNETRRWSFISVALPLAIGGAAVAAAQSAPACDTPVYRYAVYRWEREPYLVVRLTKGERLDEQAKAVRAAVEELRDNHKTPANIDWFEVDIEADPKLQSLPPWVRPQLLGDTDAQDGSEDNAVAKDALAPATPEEGYLVFAPDWALVHSGALTVADVTALATCEAARRLRRAAEIKFPPLLDFVA